MAPGPPCRKPRSARGGWERCLSWRRVLSLFKPGGIDRQAEKVQRPSQHLGLVVEVQRTGPPSLAHAATQDIVARQTVQRRRQRRGVASWHFQAGCALDNLL